MKFQIGDIVERIAYEHGNVKTGERRTVVELNCGLYDNKVRLSGDMPDNTHEPNSLKLVKHKDMPYEEIPDGAVFTMLFDLNRPTPSKCIIKRNVNSDYVHMITKRGDYRPNGGYGIANATFSLSTPEERMLLESHMGVHNVPPSAPNPPITNNSHYSIY